MNKQKNERVSRLFPAFGAPPAGNEERVLAACGVDLDAMYSSCICCATQPQGESLSREIKGDGRGLGSQLYTYTISCAFSDVLTRGKFYPDYSCGYSMGLYAAFYDSGAYSFETGARLLCRAYGIIEESIAGAEYSTAVVVGLDPDDLGKLVARDGATAEIVNVNNRHSMVITSLSGHMPALVAAARAEGAINIALMEHSHPYHMKILERAAEIFRDEIGAMAIGDCRVPVLSSRSGLLVTRAADVREELSRNLCESLDWSTAMEWQVACGVRHFIECGPGRSLTRFARFIPGDFHIGTAAELLASEGTRKNAS